MHYILAEKGLYTDHSTSSYVMQYWLDHFLSKLFLMKNSINSRNKKVFQFSGLTWSIQDARQYNICTVITYHLGMQDMWVNIGAFNKLITFHIILAG